MSIKPSEIEDILEYAWPVRDTVVPCFIGAPGIGKTESVYRFAEKKGANVVEIIASQILPNEVSGITMPVNETKSMEVYDHARLSSLKDGDILFLDELYQGSESVLSACLTLIQERRLLSGRKLPDIMIVAAANPLPSNSMVPMAVRQRFFNFEVRFDVIDFAKYFINRYGVLLNKDTLVAMRSNLENVSDTDLTLNLMTPRSLCKLVDMAVANNWSLLMGNYLCDGLIGRHYYDKIRKSFMFSNRDDTNRKITDAIIETLLEYDSDGKLNNDMYANVSSLYPWKDSMDLYNICLKIPKLGIKLKDIEIDIPEEEKDDQRADDKRDEFVCSF